MAAMFPGDFLVIPIVNPGEPLFLGKAQSGLKSLLLRVMLPPMLWLQQRISLWYFFLPVDAAIGIDPNKREPERLRQIAQQCMTVYERFDKILQQMTPEKYRHLPFFLKRLARDIERYHDDLACYIETLTDILHPDNPLITPMLQEVTTRMAHYENRRPEYSVSK